MKQRDVLWVELVERLGIDLSQPVTHLTEAQIESILRGRMDLRVFVSMTSKKDLAPVLGRAGVFLLPLSSSEWVLTHGEGYHGLEDPGPVQRFVSTLPASLTTANYGHGENGSLLNAYNIGLLSSFSDDPTIRPTISGRSFTPKFDFHVDGYPSLSLRGAQIEVDQGFEGRSVQLYEAKRGSHDSFITRQLYYPNRTHRIFQQATGQEPKPVRSFFFVSSRDGRTYRIWEYDWHDISDYESVYVRKKGCFEIVEQQVPHDLLTNILPDSSVPFFQADDIDKVLEFPFLIPQGVDNATAWASHYHLHPRQGNYYRAASEALGFVTTADGRYVLTSEGRRYVAQTPTERNASVAERMLRNPVLNRVFALARDRREEGVGDSDIARIVRESTGLTGSTPKRRASSVRSYLRWLGQTTGVVVVVGQRIYSREGWERKQA